MNSDHRSKGSGFSDNQGTHRSHRTHSKLQRQASCKTPLCNHENSKDSNLKKRINPDSPLREGPNKRQKIQHRDNSDEGISNKDYIDIDSIKKNYVSIGDFKQVADELAQIKVNFGEVSKKLDAVMKI